MHTYLSIYLFMCLFICLFVYLLVYLWVHDMYIYSCRRFIDLSVTRSRGLASTRAAASCAGLVESPMKRK